MNSFRSLISALAAITLFFNLNACALGDGDPEVSTDTTGATDGSDATDSTDVGEPVPGVVLCWDFDGDQILDPEEDLDHTGTPTPADCRGQDGADGKSCTVTVDKAGALVSCSDGSQVLVKNGANGAAGLNGTSCTAVDTNGGVIVKCQDGTEAVLNDGIDGKDGTSCTVENSGTYNGCVQFVCGGLKSEPVCDGKDGANGQDGQPGTGASQCQDDSDCPTLPLCVDGDATAQLQRYCWDGACLPKNLEVGAYCDFGCSKGSCLPECDNSAECAPGYVCTDGSCQVDTVPQPECSSNSDCYVPPSCSGNILGTPTHACISGQCVATGGGSTTCQYGCSQGACNAAPNCNDGIPCTVDSMSAGGVCQHVTDATVCQDGDICTTNSCVLGSGCTVTFNTSSCDDGSACTVGESCSGGSCNGGTAKVCDDGNPATADSCDPTSGCKYTPISGTMAITWSFPYSQVAQEVDQLELFVECYTGTGQKAIEWNLDAKKVAKGSYTGSLMVSKNVGVTIVWCKANAHLLAITPGVNFDAWTPGCSGAAGAECNPVVLGTFSYVYTVGSTTYAATAVGHASNGASGRQMQFILGSDNDGDGHANSLDGFPSDGGKH